MQMFSALKVAVARHVLLFHMAVPRIDRKKYPLSIQSQTMLLQLPVFSIVLFIASTSSNSPSCFHDLPQQIQDVLHFPYVLFLLVL